MDTLERLLDKFWKGETTPEENTLLEKLLSQQELDVENQESVLSTGSIPEMKVNAGEILQRIHRRIEAEPRKGATIIRLMRKAGWWAAASIVFILCGYWLINNSHPRQPVATAARSIGPKRELRQVSNSGQSVLELHLEDGSQVRLEPNSAISYYEPFGPSTRDISITGEAYFKVAKEVSRSFTVYANDIATTALGTAFSVNNRIKDSIAVKLFEGKVMVRSTRPTLTEKVVYLRPGEECRWDRTTSGPVVLHFAAHTGANGTTKYQGDSRTRSAPTELRFQKESLEKVFDKISKLYAVTIRFEDRQQMQRLRFTGTFAVPADSLSSILGVICNMSELQYTRNGNTITISKPK